MNRVTLFRIVEKLYRALSRVTVENENLLPAEGPVLIVMNHISFWDFPALTLQRRRDDWNVFIASSYKNHPVFSRIANSVQLVWIDRGKADFTAIKQAYGWLQNGGAFSLSPEGTRSRSKALLRAKEGVAMIALKASVPIVPVGIVGSDRIFADLLKLRRAKVTMRFGPPESYPPIDPERRSESLREMTDDIMCRIGALLPDAMHGFYAGNPAIERIRAEWRGLYPGMHLPDSGGTA